MLGVSELPVRNDPAGSGEFGAKRGSRKHEGMDYAVQPGQKLVWPYEKSKIIRVGYPYTGDYTFRLIELGPPNGFCKMPGFSFYYKVMYATLLDDLCPGDMVSPGQIFAIAQDVRLKYPNLADVMLPHVHVECYDASNRNVPLHPESKLTYEDHAEQSSPES